MINLIYTNLKMFLSSSYFSQVLSDKPLISLYLFVFKEQNTNG